MSRFPSLESLRYAKSVQEKGSFSAAARDHGVTQPTLSNSVARLEKQLGKLLFHRSTHGVFTTEFGESIFPLIEQALDSFHKMCAEASRWTPTHPESIRLGVSPLINSSFIAQAHTIVLHMPSPPSIILQEADIAGLRDALAAGDLDLLLIPSIAPFSDFEHRVIGSEPMVVIQPCPDGNHALELSQLAETPLILTADSCGLTAFTHSLLADSGFPIQTYPGEAATYRTLEEWVAMGLGSAVLPKSKLTTSRHRHRPLLDQGVEVEIFYVAVWNPSSILAPALEGIAACLAE